MQPKWIVLSQCLRGAGGYYNARLTPRFLSSRYYARRAVIRETTEIKGDRIIEAYTALWPTYRKEWYELGTVWVTDTLRGNGVRARIMDEATNLAPEGARLFLITAVGSITRSAQDLGFFPVTIRTHPSLLLWASEIGMGERLPSSARSVDEPAFVEGVRTLFIRP